jgi:hypothetical protein
MDVEDYIYRKALAKIHKRVMIAAMEKKTHYTVYDCENYKHFDVFLKAVQIVFPDSTILVKEKDGRKKVTIDWS